ncbi:MULTISPECIES: response regulator transcription factor [Streptomyces]|uniref:Response regulator transcription factor n=1 Tax=Streptomyces olivaceus TaxID=47716 RepID=A0ABS7WD21_STROV|nr:MULTISPECIES: response regulator transcription factor [Streptomyces]MBF8170727.1 response regulator transcription factor [Streptomyces olivaceus]MBZ6084262.1 response regulator transcription factor [Streptomyces olivaceus]MBZ6093022.1 response regulator transcription factor [Streptomyces olivaceus]MBZ6099939.1 response regulator transcription factor [Streptomyces olivaceus]MBZ6105181.1 response regulator transcription factor [Streptomyces olivaceus]
MEILLAEDDDGVAGALVEVLYDHGHVTRRVTRGKDVLTYHRSSDLLLLDLGLPDVDGLEVLRRLRAVSDLSVVVLTARGDERSVVRGLRLGADDYLVKPVRLTELLARIEAVTRRTAAQAPPAARTVRVGDVEILLDARQVRVDGTEVELTAKEYDVLAVLARRAGTAVSREQVLDEVWGDANHAVSRSLDVHLTQLRAKLGRPELLTTIRGFGFRLGD